MPDEKNPDFLPEIDHCNTRSIRMLGKCALTRLKDWRNAQIDVLRQSRLLTDEDQQRWWVSLTKDPTQILFGLYVDSPKPELIGYGGLVYLNRENRRAETSFLVAPDRAADPVLYRDDLRAALAMFARYGFDELELNRIYTETFAFRDRHISILEEFGFQLEGRLRDHIYNNGKFCDSLLHSLLKSDWDIVRKEISLELAR